MIETKAKTVFFRCFLGYISGQILIHILQWFS